MPRLRALFQIRVVVRWSLVRFRAAIRGPGPASMYFNPPTQVDFPAQNHGPEFFCKIYVKSFCILEKSSNFASGKGKNPNGLGRFPELKKAKKMNYYNRLRRLVEITNNPWFKWDNETRNNWGGAVLKLEMQYKNGEIDEAALSNLEKTNPGDGFIYASCKL